MTWIVLIKFFFSLSFNYFSIAKTFTWLLIEFAFFIFFVLTKTQFFHIYRFKREQFSMPKHGGYAPMGGADGIIHGEGMYDDNLPESPMSFEEIERPPLRHIDKYVKAECPCLSQRFTVAVMGCIGFIISFGMRCNMGMAKLQLEHKVRIF